MSQAGFTDVVVWNPGPERAAALPDLELGGYRHMLCIEAEAIGQPITLGPRGGGREAAGRCPGLSTVTRGGPRKGTAPRIEVIERRVLL